MYWIHQNAFFSVVWGFCDIYYWKAVWDGIDCIFGKSIETGIGTLCIGLFVLAVFKCLRSASSVPAGHTLDDVANCCTSYTYLQSQLSDTFVRRISDTFLTVFLEFFVILAWHGLWSLTDILTMDEYKMTLLNLSFANSAKLSLLMGIIINVFVYVLQFAYSLYIKNQSHKSNILSYIYGAAFSILCIFSSVQTFRGYWFLLDVYFDSEIVGDSKYNLQKRRFSISNTIQFIVF